MTERQEFVFDCKDEETLQYYKTKTTKLKVILLDRLDKPALTNIKLMTKRDRDKFNKQLKELFETMSDKEINDEFNSICCDKLFTSGVDVSAYTCFNTSFPEPVTEEKKPDGYKNSQSSSIASAV
jgi:hypothetical protein